MRELLIRYLLGELDAQQQQHVEQRLRDSTDLRRELAHLQSCFAAARETDQSADQPPRGLARRVTDSVCGDSVAADLRPAAAEADPPAAALSWSLADMTVAGGVFLAISMLLFPALRDSRDATRRTVCQDHQRELFTLLAAAAQDDPGRYFPRILPTQNAGMFACQLVARDYITADELSVLLVCPSAPLADRIRSGELVIRIPSDAELESMTPSELAATRELMSPFFAYQFPYQIGDQYVYMRDERNPYALLISDTSGADDDMSPNHNGFVQVIRADGSLQMLQSCEVPGGDANMYRNTRGEVAAGCSRRDVVLGRSEATPQTDSPPRLPMPLGVTR